MTFTVKEASAYTDVDKKLLFETGINSKESIIKQI